MLRKRTVADAALGAGEEGVTHPRQSRYYADVPNRLAALGIDVVVLTALIFVAAIVVSVVIGPAVEFDTGADVLDDAVTLDRDVATVDAVLSLAISAAYFIGSWTLRPGTPGQRLIGMRVGCASDGSALSISRATGRWLLFGAPFGAAALLTTAAPELDDAIPDLVLVAWYTLLLVTIARSPTKQGLHDRLAGSVVAKQGSPVRWDRPRADAG